MERKGAIRHHTHVGNNGSSGGELRRLSSCRPAAGGKWPTTETTTKLQGMGHK